MKKVLFSVVCLAFAMSITSCGGTSSDSSSSSYNSSYSTQPYSSSPQRTINVGRLRKGMSVNDVIGVLGQPESRQLIGGDVYLYYPGDETYSRYQIVFDSDGRYDYYNAY